MRASPPPVRSGLVLQQTEAAAADGAVDVVVVVAINTQEEVRDMVVEGPACKNSTDRKAG